MSNELFIGLRTKRNIFKCLATVVIGTVLKISAKNVLFILHVNQNILYLV